MTNAEHNTRDTNFSYLKIDDLISLIEKPLQPKLRKMLSNYENIFREAKGSAYNHQAWSGGYLDHIEETMNIAHKLYDQLNSLRSLPFSKSDALVSLFAHDLEKPWKYEKGPDGYFRHKKNFQSKGKQHDFRIKKLKEYGITLTPEQENAVQYAEGELDDYTNKERTMGPLAAFCHVCDILSARLWFDYPLNKGDSWKARDRNF